MIEPQHQPRRRVYVYVLLFLVGIFVSIYLRVIDKLSPHDPATFILLGIFFGVLGIMSVYIKIRTGRWSLDGAEPPEAEDINRWFDKFDKRSPARKELDRREEHAFLFALIVIGVAAAGIAFALSAVTGSWPWQ
jgi:hypothetical protein